jgi:outer membrane lipoprotein carrier protein
LKRIQCAVLAAVLVGFILGPCAYSRAQTPDGVGADHEDQLDTILRQIQSHYQKTSTLKARFTENMVAADGRKRERSGTIYYRKPGKMRWNFDGPEAETIVSDGHEIYTYAPDLNQVMKAPLERVFKSSAPVAFLLGVGDIKRDFKAALPASPPSDGLVHVILTPKAGGEIIDLGVDPHSYDLRWMKVQDQLGNSTTFHLQDLQTNVALNNSLFVFEVPKGADIVEPPSPR